MIKSFRLGNFKAFAETQQIPIRPLTIIFGANSSGKSSIIHSLLFAQNALETGELDTYRMNIGGESVDLGGFRQYIHRRDPERQMTWAAELDMKDLGGWSLDLLVSAKCLLATARVGLPQIERKEKRRIVNQETKEVEFIDVPTGEMASGGFPQLMSYEIEIDHSPILSMSRRPDATFQVDRVDADHPVFLSVFKALIQLATTADDVSPTDAEYLRKHLSELVPTLKSSADKFIPGTIQGVTASESGSNLGRLFPISKGRRQEDLAAALQFYMPRVFSEILRGTRGALSSSLGGLRYLGPLRSFPARHLAFAEPEDRNWYAGGGYAWDIVRQDEKVRQLVNGWLGDKTRLQTPYELVVRRLVDSSGGDVLNQLWKTIENNAEKGELIEEDETGNIEVKQIPNADTLSFAYLIQEALKNPDLVEGINELVLIDRRSETTVSHRDVGIGISQVLPVLVTAFANDHKTIAIEQPEIHLHPGLQAELGDVFIESALGERKNTCVLETHSEHIILRILKRIRQSGAGKNDKTPPIKPEDVSLLFVGPAKEGSEVVPIRVDDRGRLIDRVPDGFFEEDFEELF